MIVHFLLQGEWYVPAHDNAVLTQSVPSHSCSLPDFCRVCLHELYLAQMCIVHPRLLFVILSTGNYLYYYYSLLFFIFFSTNGYHSTYSFLPFVFLRHLFCSSQTSISSLNPFLTDAHFRFLFHGSEFPPLRHAGIPHRAMQPSSSASSITPQTTALHLPTPISTRLAPSRTQQKWMR